MNTLQGIMDQIRSSQDHLQNLGVRPSAETAQPEPRVSAAGPASISSLPVGDALNLSFNPAQFKPGELESAHKPLDPNRVAQLLGLVEEPQA